MKTNASINARLNPEVFKPTPDSTKPKKPLYSQKTLLGYHDLSALLLNPQVPISKQQYKTIQANQTFVFMPLSFAEDQGVFQNINLLAKLNREERPDFYDKVIDIRSKMTRIKLLAEHDMATQFVKVGTKKVLDPETKKTIELPKFKYTVIGKTDISMRDEGTDQKPGPVPKGTFGSKCYLNEIRLDDALDPNKRDNLEKHPNLATEYPDLANRERKKKLVTWLKNELKSLTGGPGGVAKQKPPDELYKDIQGLLHNKKAQERLAKEMNPAPTYLELEFYIELLVNKSGGKTKQLYTTTPAIFEARQSAAINFEALVLGQMMRYAEVTIAYRQHGFGGTGFPKFAKFDGNVWIVGTVNTQNVFTETAETFPDKPV